MITRNPQLLTLFIIILAIYSCKTTQPAETTVTKTPPKIDCSSQIPVYQLDIQPILEKNCNLCHGEQSAGGYDFRDLDDIMRSANNGSLLGSIKWDGYYSHMPARADKLDDFTIKKIECWINTGMK